MTPLEIEQAVYELEEIRIVIRANVREAMGNFVYERKAAGNTSIAEWLEQRIVPIVGRNAIVVIDGTGALPHGRTRLEKLRESYVR